MELLVEKLPDGGDTAASKASRLARCEGTAMQRAGTPNFDHVYFLP